jgi:hypothetical protein
MRAPPAAIVQQVMQPNMGQTTYRGLGERQIRRRSRTFLIDEKMRKNEFILVLVKV